MQLEQHLTLAVWDRFVRASSGMDQALLGKLELHEHRRASSPLDALLTPILFDIYVPSEI